jgi:hypothetical protein
MASMGRPGSEGTGDEPGAADDSESEDPDGSGPPPLETSDG